MNTRPHQIIKNTPLARKASWDDVEAMTPHLRKSDVLELEAASGNTAEFELAASYLASHQCWAIELNNRVICLFGVSPKKRAASDVALAWMLGTDDIYTIARTMLTTSRSWVDKLMRDYRVLMNFVDARNAEALKWVRWNGFELIRCHENYGVNGEAFWEIRREASVAASKLAPVPKYAVCSEGVRNPNRLLIRQLAAGLQDKGKLLSGTIQFRLNDASGRSFWIDLAFDGATFHMGEHKKPDCQIELHIDAYMRLLRRLPKVDFGDTTVLRDVKLHGDPNLLSTVAQAIGSTPDHAKNKVTIQVVARTAQTLDFIRPVRVFG